MTASEEGSKGRRRRAHTIVAVVPALEVGPLIYTMTRSLTSLGSFRGVRSGSCD
jgi:hypothetical protein